ncbi:secreted RxLR effector protein 78-like [Silene latifolia]|uniref:secreted RxLR effector protein 78-like n=1 Tax=Silene latifolia TaxID=37657 RepID=UPI003D777004
MGSLVSESQNAFIPGRYISDNILLAHETIHRILSHKKGKHGRCAFKADMSKAYDRIKWDFLEAVLMRFGFPPKLVQLIMNCVTTVSYEVLFNGAPLPRFQPHCGLRQGDPLSPYLFILCMEVLGGQIE